MTWVNIIKQLFERKAITGLCCRPFWFSRDKLYNM